MDIDEREDDGGLELSAGQLRGKQSVRATFRLSNQMIDLLKVAANHLEVKQKSLIDELVQSRETLDRVAGDAADVEQQGTVRRQKTFVLSRYSLDLLDDISDKHNLSRDFLVELCISRLIPFVGAEQEKHEQRRQLLTDIETYLKEGRNLLRKADKMLGPEDRFRLKLEKIVSYADQNVREMRKYVKEKKSLLY